MRRRKPRYAPVHPGLRVSEVVDVINDVLTDGGLAFPGDGQAGHCIGMTGHEPPMIARGEAGVIEQDMVLALETWVTGGNDGYNDGLEPSDLFGCEDLVVVTRGDVIGFRSFLEMCTVCRFGDWAMVRALIRSCRRGSQ